MNIRNLGQPQVPARVVIVGAGGFIGRAVVEIAEHRGWNTLRISARSPGVTSVVPTSALYDPNVIAPHPRPDDVMIVLAAVTPDRKKPDAAQVNAMIAGTLVEALRRQPVRHIVYVSSDAVYAAQPKIVDEDAPPAAPTAYGAVHRLRELMFVETGIPTAIVRLTGVYGRGDTHNSYGPNRFIKAIEAGEQITLFNGGADIRDHIHVSEAATLLLECARSRTEGIINGATGESTSFEALARLICKIWGREDGIRWEPTVNVTPTERVFRRKNLRIALPHIRFLPIQEHLEAMKWLK